MVRTGLIWFLIVGSLLSSLVSLRILNNNPPQVTHLQLRSYVTSPVIKANSTQGVTVIVLNQNYSPVAQAQVTVNLLMPDSTIESYTLPVTNNYGISQIDGIWVQNLPASQMIVVKVSATYAGLQSSTSTWFQIWW